MANPTPADLLAATGEHLAYELAMLEAVYDPFAKERAALDQRGESFSTQSNVLIESFAIHFRAVAAFLYCCDLRPDDMQLRAFLPPGSTWPLDSTLLRPGPWSMPHYAAGMYYRRASKQVAHLTWERLEPPQLREWNFLDALRALAPSVRLFGDSVDPSVVDHRFRDSAKLFLSRFGSSTVSWPA